MTDSPSVAYDFEDLYPALGQLVVASADMESRLRYVVSELAGNDDAGWIVFEGQSVEWLVSNGIALLGQLEEMRRWPTANSQRIRSALLAAQEVNRLRNLMVHGEWRAECVLPGEGCVGRPGGSPPDHRVFHVCRSRYRKGFEERQFAVIDVETIASKMWDLETELREASKAAVDAWLGRSAVVPHLPA
ncbi:hypothetical protein [Streptomyces sp. NPDC096013]|uniref:hypothetical protein n=1 Tax=Streptomyces sp. NPDC096013 TaxID=3366069 RepID=UPI00382C92C3